MNARFSDADEAFRAEVRALLAEFRDLDGYFRMGTHWSRVTHRAASTSCGTKQRTRAHQGPRSTRASSPRVLWQQSLWESIGGGTSEIMRSVVAKQVLGLG